MTTARQSIISQRAKALPGPKRGDALFEGTTYPRAWDEYVGQDDAVRYLRASCQSAKIRETRLEHTLIATGFHGIGKSAFARLIAHEMDVGLVEVQGAVTEQEALRIFSGMNDGDILFYDEFHLAVSKGRAKAEWLLSVLQDGVMVTSRGVTAIPDITVIAATTDIQKVPETIISRFVIKPAMEEYTLEQAMSIGRVTANKLWKDLPLVVPNDQVLTTVALAGNCNPREITQLLKTLRDSALTGYAIVTADGTYSTDMMFQWSKVSPDGLDKLAQDYLETLHVQLGGKAGEKTIAATLGEPTAPRHTEKLLARKGFLRITAGGRELTAEGIERAMQVLHDRGYLEG